jgi:phytoene dehydrogenase-like protein
VATPSSPQVADFEELERRRDEDLLATGEALIAGLYEACLDAGIEFMTGSPAKELIEDEGWIVGLAAEQAGEEVLVEARAVVIAAEVSTGMRTCVRASSVAQ